MADYRVQYTEHMVGANHPSFPDTINRLALVEHNNDGTHKRLTQVTDPWVDVRSYGAVGDGTTDDSTAVQNAINYVRDFSNGKGGIVFLPLGWWNLGTAGITLYEGVQLIGAGKSSLVSNVKAGGAWLIYTGTGNAITIDGDWPTFDSRRNIRISNLNVLTQSGVNAAIYCDFLTLFEIDRVYLEGAAACGIYMTNSYNGTIRTSKINGAGTGLYSTTKASPDDVFTGQMLIMDTDIWNCTAKGLHINGLENVMAQWMLLKNHFKTNAYGAYLEGANLHRVNLRGCHFEGNTTNDLYVHSDVTQGPIVDGCHFNNNAVYKINCQGDKAQIINNELTGGGTGYGVLINGDDNRIAHNHFQGMADSKQIVIDTSAAYTTIGKNTFSNSTGRVVDNSAGGTTIFEGETVLESKLFDLSAAAETELTFVALRDYWIRDARIVYQEATSSDAGVALQFGDSDSLTRYVNHTSDASQAAYAVVTPALASDHIAKGRRVTFRCAGGKTGTGTARFTARLLTFSNS